MPDLNDPAWVANFADKDEAEMFRAGLTFLGIESIVERVKDDHTLEFGRHYRGHVRVLVSAKHVESARAHLAAWRAASGHGGSTRA